MLSRRKKQKKKAKTEDDSDEEPESHYTCVNNLRHSLFSICKFTLTIQWFTTPMAYKAQIFNEINSSSVSIRGIIALVIDKGLKNIPEALDMHPFTDRTNSLGTGIVFSLYGRLAIDLFTCEKLIIPKTKIRIKLTRATPNFYMLSDKSSVSLKNVDCLLFSRRIL